MPVPHGAAGEDERRITGIVRGDGIKVCFDGVRTQCAGVHGHFIDPTVPTAVAGGRTGVAAEVAAADAKVAEAVGFKRRGRGLRSGDQLSVNI